MKQSFRKAISAFCAAAMLISTLAVGSVGAFAENTKVTLVDNLARTATMTADSEYRASVAAAKANDGDFTTYLQSNCQSGGDAWVCATWATAQTFDKIVFYCREGAKLVGKDYGVQVWDATSSSFKDLTVKKADSKIGTAVDWESYNAAGTKTGSGTKTENRDMGMSTMTFDAQTTTAVRVIAKNFNNGGSTATAFHVLELEVYAPSSVEPTVEPTEEPTLPEYALTENLVKPDMITGNAAGEKALLADGKVDTGAVTGAASNAVKVDLGEMAEISKVVIWFAGAPSGTSVKGSTDNSTWFDLTKATEDVAAAKFTNEAKDYEYTKTAEPAWQRWEMTPKDTAKMRYIRIAAGGSGSFSVLEIEVFGTLASDLPPTVETSSKKVTVGATNIALTGTGFAVSQRNGSSSPAKLNDGTANGFWNPAQAVTAGDKLYAGICWTTGQTVKELNVFWRDVKSYAPAETACSVAVSYDTTNGTDGKWETVESTVTRTKGAFADIIKPRFPNDTDNQNNTALDKITLTDAATGVKGVRIEWTAAENMASGFQQQLYELEIYPEEYTAPATSFNKSVAYWRDAESGIEKAKDVYVFTDIAQECVTEDQVARVTIKATRSGRTESTSVLIWEAWEGISLTADGSPVTVSADKLGNTKDAYVIGILLTDLLAGDEVDVSFSIVDIPEE